MHFQIRYMLRPVKRELKGQHVQQPGQIHQHA